MTKSADSALDCLYIYMLECDNGAYYTGYTKDLQRRFQQHLSGTANARYTRSFKPLRLVQCWQLFADVGIALQIERWIKRQGRKTKERLVQQPEELPAAIAKKLKMEVKLQPCLTAFTDRSL
ncbi:MAG: GIY-YIG nuclease family protein [candidate division KSB1 bacterium]|nr:GIY-YIG nuclease family protein [candidate division KSB1 bacterium]